MKNYSEYFVRGKRQDGKEYVYCVDATPEKLRDLIRDIHFNSFDGCFPNDWIYENIYEAFEMFEERDFDIGKVLCDLTHDPYPWHLVEWLHNSFASEFCNDVTDNDSSLSIFQILETANCKAKESIVFAVDRFLKERE